ncbi:MAG: hypothetical protein PHW74_03410 [Desulfobacca sp.]|nr:hypothetical protein [Desulfobacca sp.]
MKDAINMVELVAELAKRPRVRACLVLTHDYRGQKPWAAELARQTGAEHLDLLDQFVQNPDLAARVSTFSVAALFDYLKNYRNSPVLIVSRLEFLKAVWSAQPQTLPEFISRVETWHQSPALLFIIQSDPALAEIRSTRYPQYTFSVDIRETLALT